MSYSFSVRGATKTEVTEKIASELDKVVAGQPVHAADKEQAKAAAASFVSILPELGEDQDYSVSMNGSVGGLWDGSALAKLTSASVSVSASLVAKQSA